MSRPYFKLSLRFKLFAAFVIMALTPLLLLAVFNGRSTRRILVNEANHSLLTAAQEVSKSVDDFIHTTQKDLAIAARLPLMAEYIASSPEERSLNQKEDQLLDFMDTLVKNEHLRSMAILDTVGNNLLDSHQPYQNQSEANLAYFNKMRSSRSNVEATVSAVQFRPDSDKALLLFGQTILNDQGEPIGYLRAEYDAHVLQDIVALHNDSAGEGSFGTLFDEHFVHLAHGTEPDANFAPVGRLRQEIETELISTGHLPPDLAGQQYPMQFDELSSNLSTSAAKPFFEVIDPITGNSINRVAVSPLVSQPWLVAFFQPTEMFMAPIEKQRHETALIVAIITGLAVLVSYLFGGILVKPITSLTKTVSQFSDGDLLARSKIATDDEIGILATHFNEMAERVSALLTGLESRTEALEHEAVKYLATEARLRRQSRFLRQVIDINPSFIFAKDRDGRFVMVNQAFAETYNTTIDYMIGKTDADFIPDSQKVAQFRRDDLQVFESGQELFIPEQKAVNAFGEVRWWQTIKRPLRNRANEVTEVLTIVTEITERKQHEEALHLARDRALAANRVKSEILANANHELQTPLSAILGYAEMIETGYFGNLTDKQHEILRKIIARTHQLTTLIQDLLAQASLEAKKESLSQTQFKPQLLLQEMHQRLNEKAAKKGVALTSEIAAEFPGSLVGVPERIQRILTKLVENGIKFTDEGFVHVRIFQPDNETWAIEVSDSGPGIPAEAQNYVFEPFRQVDGSITRMYQGFGLGLSLVKALALTMEGDVSLASELGKGSIFTVTFPYIPSKEFVT